MGTLGRISIDEIQVKTRGPKWSDLSWLSKSKVYCIMIRRIPWLRNRIFIVIDSLSLLWSQFDNIVSGEIICLIIPYALFLIVILERSDREHLCCVGHLWGQQWLSCLELLVHYSSGCCRTEIHNFKYRFSNDFCWGLIWRLAFLICTPCFLCLIFEASKTQLASD